MLFSATCFCRSALDELAGRGGRGPEDDPLRLSARGLLQFLRARIREKSLAAAPADLLPASVVCQVIFRARLHTQDESLLRSLAWLP